MATYPAAIKSFTDKVDGVDEVLAADINSAYAEITAIQTELGADVAGTATDLVTRLAIAHTNAGYLKYTPGTTLTIASGVVTVVGNYHKLETQGSAASDDLDTVNGGAAGAWFIALTVNDARDVVVKHGTGNIYCVGAKDITMGTSYAPVLFFYDTTNTRWVAMGGLAAYSLLGNISGAGTIATGGFTLTVPASGTAALLAVANVFTADQSIIDKNIILGTTTGTKIGTDPAQKLAFYGETPVVQPTALTGQLTAITHSAPGTPDYAIQDPVNSGGYGFVTLDEGLTVLQVIANLQTRVAELEAKLQSLGLLA